MFKMIGRKTLKRLTRFGLCLYIFTYCIGFTVCAEGVPDLSGSYPVKAENVQAENFEDDAEILGAATSIVEYEGNDTFGLVEAIDGLAEFENTISIQKDLKANIMSQGLLLNNSHGITSVVLNGNGHTIRPDSEVSDIEHYSLLPLNKGNVKKITIENFNFKRSDTTATKDSPYGVAIDVPYDNALMVVIKNCTFEGINGKFGGAICQGSETKMEITDCTFKNCSAFAFGGAVCGGTQASLTIKNSVFVDNSVKGSGADCYGGGAVYKHPDGSLIIENCSFINNKVGQGLEGSAVYSEASADISKCVFLKNSVDPVVYVDKNSGGGTVYDCWFGHTAENYNTTTPSVDGAEVGVYRFLDMSRKVQWNTGEYSMLVDLLNLYDPSDKDDSEASSWDLPRVTLNCSAEGCKLGSDTVTIYYDRENPKKTASVPITDLDLSYSLSLPDLDYTKSFNRTIEVNKYGGGDSIYYNGNNSFFIEGDGDGSTVEGKKVSVELAGVGNYSSTISDSYFNVYFGEKVVPGTYDVTYVVDGFMPLKTNLNVSRTNVDLNFMNGTAQDADKASGKEGSGKYWIDSEEPFEYSSGSECIVRTEIYGLGNDERIIINRGTISIYNGTANMTDTDKIIFSEKVTEDRQYVDMDLNMLEAGSYNISAVYTDETGCYNNISIMDPEGYPSSLGAHALFNITDNRSDAGVSFAEGTSLTKNVDDPEFKLNVTVKDKGTGTGKYSWLSTNSSVAEVAEDGVISLKKVGTTQIKVRYGSQTTAGSAELTLSVIDGSNNNTGNNTGNDTSNSATDALAKLFPVPVNGAVIQNQTFELGGSGTAINMNVYFTQNVTFTGSKFKAKDVEDLGNGVYSIANVLIKLNTTLLNVSKPNFKFKNTKFANDNPKAKKDPSFTISFKANSGVSKENKTSVKGANKVLKKNPVTFRIEQADITNATDVKPYANSAKTKVGKVDMSISGNKVTLKNKTDYDATITESKVSLVGKGNYKGNITVPL